ncbi:hypothetical protein CEUSTIGMA_g7281.t1 [Chlamydomonas eustigma]|uniref:Uncharacterized protein n=1 Tax=Chlamydomonas eustigma TaxID=1157962 RepID=A0A250X9S2_9CHLO|nr:hypothetical protein CEUSTIGMA_g7281.t1 [Chlamydomonas eustigma]|eukprot:GAX79841.1 hypothetical protein CEUSTIGMA_g7281.t1 [Chlamydomonas eustigma]
MKSNIFKEHYAGDVKVVHLITQVTPLCCNLLFQGCGSSLLTYAVDSNGVGKDHFLGKKELFSHGQHVHGIASSSISSDLSSLLLAVHGDRFVQLLSVNLTHNVATSINRQPLGLAMTVLATSSPLPDWIMSCAFIASCGEERFDSVDDDRDPIIVLSGGPKVEVLIAVGTAHNGIHIMRNYGTGERLLETLLTIDCTQQQLLYSMALWVRVKAVPGSKMPSSSREMYQQSSNLVSAFPVITDELQKTTVHIEIWVASGTILSKVLIWKAMCLEGTLDASSDACALPVLACCHQKSLEACLVTLIQGTDVLLRRTQEVREPLESCQKLNVCQPRGVGQPAQQKTASSAGVTGSGKQLTVHPLYTCAGHEGSVFSVSWDKRHGRLVSTSDDRSARVWEPPLLMATRCVTDSESQANNKSKVPSSSPHLPMPLVPVVTLWGHTARVWDGVLQGSLMITGSEDCTARVWNWRTRQCLAVLKGHKGRGIWKLALSSTADARAALSSTADARAALSNGQQLLLATAGADASVKIWDLSCWGVNPALTVNPEALTTSVNTEPAMTRGATDISVCGVRRDGDQVVQQDVKSTLPTYEPGMPLSGNTSSHIMKCSYVVPSSESDTKGHGVSFEMQHVDTPGVPCTATAPSTEKEDWVRCMASCSPDRLYCSTDKGHVYVIHLMTHEGDDLGNASQATSVGNNSPGSGPVSGQAGLNSHPDAAAANSSLTPLTAQASPAAASNMHVPGITRMPPKHYWHWMHSCDQCISGHPTSMSVCSIKSQHQQPPAASHDGLCSEGCTSNGAVKGHASLSGAAELVLIGHKQGLVTMMELSGSSWDGGAATAVTTVVQWQAHEREAVLDVKLLGHDSSDDECLSRTIITVGSSGAVHIWCLNSTCRTDNSTDRDILEGCGTEAKPVPGGHPEHYDHSTTSMSCGPSWHAELVAEARSPFRSRITCTAVHLPLSLLLCGDQDGAVLCFSLPQKLLHRLGSSSPSCIIDPDQKLMHRQGSSSPSCIIDPDQMNLSDELFSEVVAPLTPLSSVTLTVSCIHRSAHGSASVSLVRPLGPHTFLSAGHDGSLVFYEGQTHITSQSGSRQGRQEGAFDVKVSSSSAANSTPLQMNSSLPSSHVVGRMNLESYIPAVKEVLLQGSAFLMDHLSGAHQDAVQAVCGFQGSEFVVYSTPHQAEVIRVPCGGWRRPSCCCIDSTGTVLLFSFFQDHKVRMYMVTLPGSQDVNMVTLPGGQLDASHAEGSSKRASSSSRGGTLKDISPSHADHPSVDEALMSAGSGFKIECTKPSRPSSVRSLHINSHGREINCVQLLPFTQPPIQTSSNIHEQSGTASHSSISHTTERRFYVITGSEDGTLRRLLCSEPSHPHISDSSGQLDPSPDTVFMLGAEIGQHAEGASVRCLDTCLLLPPTTQPALELSALMSDDGSNGAARLLPASCPYISHLVISGGAKEVLTAWEVQWSMLPEGGLEKTFGASKARPVIPKHVWLGCRTGAMTQAGSPLIVEKRKGKMRHAKATDPRDQERPGVVSATSDDLSKANHALAEDAAEDEASASSPSQALGRAVNYTGLPNAKASVQSEHRYMAVLILADCESDPSREPSSQQRACVADRVVLLVCAASDASVQLIKLLPYGMSGGQPQKMHDHSHALGRSEWQKAGRLQQHGPHPILSLSYVPFRGVNSAVKGQEADHCTAWLVFGGSTDGSITVWNVGLRDHRHELMHSPQTAGGVDTGKQQDISTELIPVVLHIPVVHQSGVNGVEVSWVDISQGLVLLVSVGDDQAVVVTLLKVVAKGRNRFQPDQSNVSALLDSYNQMPVNNHIDCPGLPSHRASALSRGEIRQEELQSWQLKVIRQYSVQNAHSSAVKAIAMHLLLPEVGHSQGQETRNTAGSIISHHPHSSKLTDTTAKPTDTFSTINAVYQYMVITTGLDQRLRVWNLTCGGVRGCTTAQEELSPCISRESPATSTPIDEHRWPDSHTLLLEQLHCLVTEVLEPSALHCLSDDTDIRVQTVNSQDEGCEQAHPFVRARVLHVAVAGRGIQTFRVEIADTA